MNADPFAIARIIVDQMNDDDRRTFTSEAWRAGLSDHLTGDWEGADLDDVLDAIDLCLRTMSTKYTTIGSVRGECGHAHRSIRMAERCRHRDNNRCWPGYSDRCVQRCDGRPLSDDEVTELNHWIDARPGRLRLCWIPLT